MSILALKECISLLVLDEALRSKTFNMRTFKTINDPREAELYAQATLKDIGQGSSRRVFVLSSRDALKVALNKKGVAQNKVEADIYDNSIGLPHEHLLPKIQARGPNNIWLISELVRPLKNDVEFHRLSGVRISTLIDILELANSEGVAAVEYQYSRAINEENQDFIFSVINLVADNNLVPGDFYYPDQWGKTTDGRLVILDSGFDYDVLARHYSMEAERGEGNVASNDATRK